MFYLPLPKLTPASHNIEMEPTQPTDLVPYSSATWPEAAIDTSVENAAPRRNATPGIAFAVRQVRVPGTWFLAVAIGVAAWALLLHLVRQIAFFQDEWNFVLDRPGWSLFTLLRPHNEHWSTIPVVAYKALLAAFGIRTHLPYMALLETLHVATAFALFSLVRRRSGDVLAVCAYLAFLFGARGAGNLIWAFQIGWIASTLFGLGALIAIERDRIRVRDGILCGVMLLASLASSGVGVFFMVMVTFQVLLDRSARAMAWYLIFPAAAYAAWFLSFGFRYGDYGASLMHHPEAIGNAPGFFLNGLLSGFFGTFSLSPWQALVVAPLAVAVAVIAWRRRVSNGREPIEHASLWRLPGFANLDCQALAAGMAVLSMYGLLTVERASFGMQFSAQSRYTYSAAVFVLIALSALLRDAPWRRMRIPLGAVMFLTMAFNLVQLPSVASSMTAISDKERAEWSVLLSMRAVPGLDSTVRVDTANMPQITVADFYRAVDLYGAPVKEVGPNQLVNLDGDAVDQVLVGLFRASLTLVRTDARPALGCSPVASNAAAVYQIPGGRSLSVQAGITTDVRVAIWLQSGGRSAALQSIEIPANGRAIASLPALGSRLPWLVRLGSSAPLVVRICAPSS